MERSIVVMLYVAVMIAVVLGVDFGFFRHRFWERLAVNVGIVWCSGLFTSDSSGHSKAVDNYQRPAREKCAVMLVSIGDG